jgi:hypothetical protein
MKFRIPYLYLFLSLVTLTGLFFESSVGAQSTAIVTVTSTSVFTSLSTTTTTSSTLLTQYTTATSSALSWQTMQGATLTQYFTHTLVMSNTAETSMTTMTSTTSTIVNTETDNATVLANTWGEIFIGALALVTAVSVAAPRILTYRDRGHALNCEKCGFSNPPFVTSFCIRCGSPLAKSK